MHPPPPWLPFPEYVLRALEHPPHMFVSKLAACCAMLFLNRADPELLEPLCDKWATRFALDRPKLIRRIRQRSYSLRKQFSTFSPTDCNEEPLPAPLSCDPRARVMHLLRLVNTLIPMYFSYNWHKIDVVMRVNKEYETYVKETLLPMCTNTSAEDGLDDDEEMEFLLPLCGSTGSMYHYTSPTSPFTAAPGRGEDGSGVSVWSSRCQQCLGFATIGNIREKMMRSIKGIVIIFHAKYSAKSNEVLSLFQEIKAKQLLDSELEICVVHAVAEPELAGIYDVSWFPTIIYTPPKKGVTEKMDSCFASPHDSPKAQIASFSSYTFPNENGNAPICTSNIGNCTEKDGDLADASPGVCKETISVASSGVMEKDDRPARLHKVEGKCSLSQEAFTVSSDGSEQCFTEVLYGVPRHHESQSSLTCNSCDEAKQDLLSAMILSDGHCVYPASAPMTIHALVAWIQKEGNVTLEKERRNTVNHISVLPESNKFRSKRRESPLVFLRNMQATSRESITASQEDSPMFIFLGGGMAAGKSTVAMALSRSSWWTRHKENSVLVSADDFKVLDPSNDLPSVNEDMHEFSTRAAEALLINAVNAGRSVVFDSTMMWLPFIKQVITMVRNAHTTLYKQGAGYKKEEGIEEYFCPFVKREVPLRKPYGIHLLAITVEPQIAVPRGVVRKFSMGRGVPISTQLRSFCLFAKAFSHYIDWMDSVKLYNNNVFVDLKKGEIPPLIAEKSESTGGKFIIHDREAFEVFERQRNINANADTVLEVYLNTSNGVPRGSGNTEEGETQ